MISPKTLKLYPGVWGLKTRFGTITPKRLKSGF